MLEDKQARVYAAPEPVLGIANSVTDKERRLHKTARVAMGFAASGVVESVVVLLALFSKEQPEENVKFFLFLLLLLAPLSALTGCILGIVSRKHRTGKAAIVVSLIPVGLMVMIFAVEFAIGMLSSSRKP